MLMRTLDVDGPVHYADFGGSGLPMVLVHGLGGSHLNWIRVGEQLTQRGRVLALDMTGHGRTPLAGRSASVHAQQKLLDGFIQAVSPGEPVLLMGNSLGGAVTVLQAALHPERVAGLVLISPAQPLPPGTRVDPAVRALFTSYAVPGLGELVFHHHLTRLGPRWAVRNTFQLAFPDMSRLPAELLQAHEELAMEQAASMPWTRAAYLEACRSALRFSWRPEPYYALVRRIRAPTLLMQGMKDRFVPAESSRALARVRPDWRHLEYPDLGHAVMMESPDVFVSAVHDWWQGQGGGQHAPGAPARAMS